MAGTVNLKSKISLDDSAFTAGIKRVSRATALVVKKASAAFRKVGASIGKAAARMKNFAMIAGALTFAAAIAGAYKLGRALKDAFDLGGRLSDLSAQTGVAVKDLAILQQAFEDNGVAGDDVGKVINRLQRSISDFGAGLSTQTRAFEKLGITFDQLKGKTPLMQFQMVQNAIAKIEDPTMKAAAAMEIFGRSGGDMLALFQDSGAIERASETMGSSADILQTNAEKFDRISDLLNRASVKFQGIILALAEVAAPKILAALEKFNAMDFAGIGRRFLAGLNMERAKELLLGAMKIVGAFLGNKLVEVLRFAAHLGEVAFKHVFEKLSGDFGQRLKEKLIDVAKIAILPPPLMIAKLAKDLKEGLKTAGDDGLTLEDKLLAAKDALKDKVQKDPDPFGFNSAVDDFKNNLDQVMQDGAAQVKQLDQEYEPKPEPKPERKPEPRKPLDLEFPAQPLQDIKPQGDPKSISAPKPFRNALQISKSAAAIPVNRGALRSQFSQARGLQTGGLGSKRYTNPAREAARIAKEQKKDTIEQLSVLRDVDRKLGQGLLAQ